MSARKKAATTFLDMAATGNARRAFDLYTSENFTHHNPWFPGDARSLADAMEQNSAQNPRKSIEPVHIVEEGNVVVVHSRVRMSPDAEDIALVHIFRFEGDRVAELWDISQPQPENSPNQHGMF